MPKYIILDNHTGREWTWTSLTGLDIYGRKLIPADATAKFAAAEKMARKQGLSTYTMTDSKLVYTIKGIVGGARPGAGRKAGGTNASRMPAEQRRQNFGVRLPPDIIAWLKAQPQPAGRIIEKAVEMLRHESDPTTPGRQNK